MFPPNNRDFDLFGSAAAEECDKGCKKPCMDIIMDPEIASDSCDMLDVNYVDMNDSIAQYQDTEVFLMRQEGSQQFQQDFPELSSTWEMDLVSALDEEIALDHFPDSVMPEYSYPHYHPFFPLSQQIQDDDEPYRPREPFATVSYPQPIVAQDDYPPSWNEGLLPASNGAAAIDQIDETSGVYYDPLDHEQWASPGVSPTSMSQQYAENPLDLEVHFPEMEMTLGTPISDSFPHNTYHHGEEGRQQCPPTSTSNQDAEWDDNETYRGIPPQAKDMLFYTLLNLNDSFADLIYLQWLEVVEEFAFRPCRDVFAEYPAIRGLATMFNLRMSEDEDADGEEEVEEQGSYTPVTHAGNEEEDRCDSEGQAFLAATTGELHDDVEMRD